MHPNVHFVADLHSHMMDASAVTGLLAGIFDKEAKILHIQVDNGCRILLIFGALHPDRRPIKSIDVHTISIFATSRFFSQCQHKNAGAPGYGGETPSIVYDKSK